MDNDMENAVDKQELVIAPLKFKEYAISQGLIDLEKSKLNEELTERIEEQIEYNKKKIKIPQIAMTTLTLIFTFIWFLPEKILSHPLLGQLEMFRKEYIDNNSSQILLMWLSLLCVTTLVWIYSILKLIKEKICLENLKDEEIQNVIFESFIKDASESIINKFSRSDLVRYICGKKEKYHAGDNVAQRITELIFKRAEEKGIIENLNEKSLIDYFHIKK